MTSPFVQWRRPFDGLKTDLGPQVTVAIPDNIQPHGQPQLARRNNNPGNLAFAGQPGAEPGDKGFARFQSAEDGYRALLRQVKKDQGRGLPLAAWVEKYAPRHENNTDLYIEQMARHMGVDPAVTIDTLPADELAMFVARKESGAKVEYFNPVVQLRREGR